MKVLHVISSGGMYGAEAVILNLSRELRREGHESVIASFSNASRQLHERASLEGFESILLPCKTQIDLTTARFIRKAVAQHRPDVVHCHGYKADLYLLLAARDKGIPLVSTCHTWYDTGTLVRMYGALDRWALRAFARVVAVSAQVEERLLESGVRPERIQKIRNGIEATSFEHLASARDLSLPHRLLYIGLVGRLAWEKGVDIFIEAAATLAKAHEEVRFIVFGEGPQRSALQALIDRFVLQGRMTLAGQREDMQSAYAQLDILVSASRQEGLPIALLEGMASGLPVVATTVGEVPTVVSHGKTGLLVPPGDAAALAAAITELVEDDSKRKSFGRCAQRIIRENFSVELMTREYLKVYREAAIQAASQ